MLFRSLSLSIALFFLFIAAFGQDTLKVGIIKFKSEESVMQTFGPLMQHLAAKVGREAKVEIVDENDLGFRVNRGDYDLGIFTVFPYLKAKTDFPELSVFATHLVNNKEYYNGYIVTGSNIKNYSDLNGKEILFVKESSTSGFKIPNGVLREHNIDIEQDLNYSFSGDHTAALWALDSGRVDAVAVDDRRFNEFRGPNKSSFNKLSEFIVPYHAYVFSPSLDQRLKEEFANVLFQEHKDPDAKSLFDNPLNVTQFIPEDDDYYNELRRFMRIVRVKPSVVVSIKPSDHAFEVLGNKRDLIRLIEGRIQQELQNSHRFGDVYIEEGSATYDCAVDLFSTEEGIFNYQVKLNDRFIGDGEIPVSEFRKRMPIEFSQWLLKGLPLQTDLLFNGEDWFITYGTDDGINKTDYHFDILLPNSGQISIEKDEVKSATALNIFFENNSDFKKGSKVQINYDTPIGESSDLFSNEEENGTYNIFSRAFWAGSGLWDKIGLIGGILFAMLSAVVGKILADRKKQRFKNILYQTNDLIKEYVEGHYKLEAKLIEQKDFIAQALEDGHINENQFLILKNRIEDMQNLIEVHHKGEVQLADDQTDEIRDIIRDGKVTEKEFSRIMNIIKKGASKTESKDN